MARPRKDAGEAAAAAASEAARILQQRQQESLAAKSSPVASESLTEPQAEPLKQPDETKIKRGNKDRQDIMAEIRKSRGEPTEDAPVEAPKAPEAAPPVEAVEPKAEEPAAPEAAVEAPEVPVVPKVKVKVDGEEFEVEQSEIDEYGSVRAYQTAKAAENRLAKSKEIAEETRKNQAQTQAQLAQLTQLLLSQQQKATPAISDADFIKSKVDVIRFGTPEESAAALQEILTKGQQKVDPQAIVQQATNKFAHDLAVRDFFREFPEIASQPLLTKLADTIARERGSKLPVGQHVDWPNFYRTIGNEIRGVAGRQSQPASVPTAASTPSSLPEKEARKASKIVNLPTAAARAEGPKEEKPETREESLARMKKARGLS